MKELRASPEMVQLMEEHHSAIKCRDMAIKLLFRTNKAVKFGVIAEKNIIGFVKLQENYIQNSEKGLGYIIPIQI